MREWCGTRQQRRGESRRLSVCLHIALPRGRSHPFHSHPSPLLPLSSPASPRRIWRGAELAERPNRGSPRDVSLDGGGGGEAKGGGVDLDETQPKPGAHGTAEHAGNGVQSSQLQLSLLWRERDRERCSRVACHGRIG